MSVRIAVVQQHSRPGAVEANRDRALRFADVKPEEVFAARAKNPWFTGQRRDLYC